MKILRLLASRSVIPLCLSLFGILYVGTAFITDDALVALMDLTRRNALLLFLLGLIPISAALRLVFETIGYLRRRRLHKGQLTPRVHQLFGDQVQVRSVGVPVATLGDLLARRGYRTAQGSGLLFAWRGIDMYPARACLLCGALLLFAGVLFSVAGRGVERDMMIEGEPLPAASGSNMLVDRLDLRHQPGALLFERWLDIRLGESGGRGGGRMLGIYPPGLVQGRFVYPRYLGLAVNLGISGPGISAPMDAFYFLMVSPPGREDSWPITGSPYTLHLSLGEGAGDPFMAGEAPVRYRITRGDELVTQGSVSRGGQSASESFAVRYSHSRRFVATDFVADRGVPLIWLSLLFYAMGSFLYLAMKFLVPGQAMLFFEDGEFISAFSRSDGRPLRHQAVFHEAVDAITGAAGPCRGG